MLLKRMYIKLKPKILKIKYLILLTWLLLLFLMPKPMKLKKKQPNITNLATDAALTAFEKKILMLVI